MFNSRRYIDIIQDLVDAYNNSRHRSIKMPPAAINKDNEKTVFKNLYKLKPQKKVSFKYSVGNTVRISKLRVFLEKVMNKRSQMNIS